MHALLSLRAEEVIGLCFDGIKIRAGAEAALTASRTDARCEAR